MKETYETYKIGSKVFAISRYYDNGKETDHLAIYEGTIIEAMVSLDEKGNPAVTYWLKDMDYNYNESEINPDINVLIEKAKEVWKINSK